MSAQPALDLDAVSEALAEYLGAPGFINIYSLPEKLSYSFATDAAGIREAAAVVAQLNADGEAGVYVRGTTLREQIQGKQRGGADQSSTWIAVQLDLDHGKAGYAPDLDTVVNLIGKASLPPPTAIHDSGHGAYPRWSFSSPVPDSPEVHKLVADMAAEMRQVFSDAEFELDETMSVDAARVWRLPGTVNRKHPDAPVPCRVHERRGRAYAFDELRAEVSRASSAAPAPSSSTQPLATGSGLVNAQRGLDTRGARRHLRKHAKVPLRDATYPRNVNIRLNNAAVAAGNLVPAFMTAAQARDYLRTQLLAGPGARYGWTELNSADRATIESGLRRGMAEPFVRDPDPDPDPVADEAVPFASDDERDAFEAAQEADTQALRQRAIELGSVAAAKADLAHRARLDAAERVRLESAEPLRRLTFAEFLASPQPEYLVPQMLYRDGLASVFGPPGGAKSFLLLDIGLSLATGTPWRGQDLGRARVHYVMAEGQGTNNLRTHAWLYHHGIEADQAEGWFDTFPQAVLLTEQGVRQYLTEVERDQPDLIVLDTKNLMFEGKESAGEDAGALLRVLHRLRRAAEGAAVVLIDHTGLSDDSRARGSNATKAGTETEVRVIDRDGVREVEVTRDKSGEPGARWAFQLREIPEVPRPPKVKPPAVCVPIELDELDATSPFPSSNGGDAWWEQPRLDLPEVITALPNADGDAARDIFRVLHYIGGHDGLTVPAIQASLAESPRPHSRSAVYRARARLEELGLIEPGTTPARYRLTQPFAPPTAWQAGSC